MSMSQKMVSIHEAAEFLGVAAQRLGRWGMKAHMFQDRNYSHGSAYSSPERAIWMATRGL